MAGDYTQQRHAAAAEAVQMGQVLKDLQMAEVGLYRELSTEQDPIRIQQLMEELKDIQKAIKQAQKAAMSPEGAQEEGAIEAPPPEMAPAPAGPPPGMAPEMAPPPVMPPE